jgi:RNA polymerase sigma-70 factor (ECF subfamily)
VIEVAPLAHDALVNAPAAIQRLVEPAQRARLARMVARDYKLIWRLLRRLGLPASAADDGAQQVFLIAAERLADIQPDRERAFAYGCALRVAQTSRRKSQRESPGLDGEALVAPSDPEQQLTTERARARLDALLAQLPLELRTVFVLYELEELTTPEIASMIEVPLGTAASRLRRARERFRELLRGGAP